MDPELKKLLEDNLALAQENNKMLRAMRRSARASLIWKIFFWVLVLISPFFLYSYYLQPLMQQYGVSSGSQSGFSWANVFGLPSKDQIDATIQSYQQK